MFFFFFPKRKYFQKKSYSNALSVVIINSDASRRDVYQLKIFLTEENYFGQNLIMSKFKGMKGEAFTHNKPQYEIF